MLNAAIESLLKNRGYKGPFIVEGRASIANIAEGRALLFKMPKDRCGIYVLHFANGEHYIGQSIDVVRRYSDHRKNHSDINHISFRKLPQLALNDEEKFLIAILQSQCVLRNIKLTVYPYGDTDFDQVMNEQDQERWLSDFSFVDLAGDRLVNDKLRRRHAAKFAKLMKNPFADDVILATRAYVQVCIPAIKRSEITFWEVSCFPSNYRELAARLNINWQTAFDACIDPEGKYEALYVIYITRTLATEALGISLKPLERYEQRLVKTIYFRDGHKTDVHISKSSLTTGGQDQVYLEVRGIKNILRLLADPQFIYGIRSFNLNLIRRGVCPWAESHCLDLADKLIEPDQTMISRMITALEL
jgi:hypothetical protein